MKNEFNEIKYSNSFDNRVSEFNTYKELNSSKFQQNDKIKEFESYKEKNDSEKVEDINSYTPTESEVIKTTASSKTIDIVSKTTVVSKIVASVVAISSIAVLGTNIILGPVTKISDVYIGSEENTLYVSVMFSDYNEEEELELSIENDFTSRTYKIENIEESNVDDVKSYYYSTMVEGLKNNVTYSIKIYNGLNVLYSENYTIDYKEDDEPIEPVEPVVTDPTVLVNFLAMKTSELSILIDLGFESIDTSDDIKLVVKKDSEIIKTYNLNELVDNLAYNDTLNVTEYGIYTIEYYLNDTLTDYKEVDLSQTTSSVILSFSLENDNSTIYYYIDFNRYSTEDQVYINVIDSDGSTERINVTDISQLHSSGEYIVSKEGHYTLDLYVNDTKEKTEEIDITITPNYINSFNAYFDVYLIRYEIDFDEVSETDDIKLVFSLNGEEYEVETINLALGNPVEDAIEVQENGTFEVVLYINDQAIETKNIEVSIVETEIEGFEATNDNGLITYEVMFNSYNPSTSIYVEIYRDLNDTPYKADITSDNGFNASGTYQVTRGGTYTLILYVDDKESDRYELDVTIDSEALVNSYTASYSEGFISYSIDFNRISDNETFEIFVMRNDVSVDTITLTKPSNYTTLNDSYKVTEVGEYNLELRIDGELIDTKNVIVETVPEVVETVVSSVDFTSDERIISYSIVFESFNPDDNIKVKIQKGETEEALLDENITIIENLRYEGSLEVNRGGDYVILIFKGDENINYEETYVTITNEDRVYNVNTTVRTEDGSTDRILDYAIDFNYIDPNDTVRLELTLNGENAGSETINGTDITSYMEYSGSFNLSGDGEYELLVFVNDELSYTKQVDF